VQYERIARTEGNALIGTRVERLRSKDRKRKNGVVLRNKRNNTNCYLFKNQINVNCQILQNATKPQQDHKIKLQKTYEALKPGKYGLVAVSLRF
jgi:hypothetical protein